MPIVTRSTTSTTGLLDVTNKGTSLTHAEVDGNFIAINDALADISADKIISGNTSVTVTGNITSVGLFQLDPIGIDTATSLDDNWYGYDLNNANNDGADLSNASVLGQSGIFQTGLTILALFERERIGAQSRSLTLIISGYTANPTKNGLNYITDGTNTVYTADSSFTYNAGTGTAVWAWGAGLYDSPKYFDWFNSVGLTFNFFQSVGSIVGNLGGTTTLTVSSDSTTLNTGLNLRSGLSNYPFLDITGGPNASDVELLLQNWDSAAWIGTWSSHPLYFYTNGTNGPWLSLNTSGALGIGNGTDTTIDYGTSGQLLKSNGNGNPPSWVSTSDIKPTSLFYLMSNNLSNNVSVGSYGVSIGASGAARIYIESTSNRGAVGIGTQSPTAALHIKAGTATANTAPLKFTSGTHLTTAESGAVEYNGTAMFATGSATTGRGIIMAPMMSRVSTDVAVSGNSATPVTITGFTLPYAASTLYYFRAAFRAIKVATTTANSISLRFNFSTAIASAEYVMQTTTNVMGTVLWQTQGAVTSFTHPISPVQTGASSAGGDGLILEGWIKTGGTAGTLSLQYLSTTVNLGTIKEGSWIMIQPMASTTAAATIAGNWT